MKTVILCGGIGYRLKEETEFKPKPMVTIGGMPILWHIMKMYSHYGYNEFIIALGYKGDYIKEYFLNQKYFSHDFSINTKTGVTQIHKKSRDRIVDDFKITFVDTGSDTLPGERILRIQEFIPEKDDMFMVTYGDGVSDINIQEIVDFHKKQNKIGTVTGVHPRSKWGLLRTKDNNTVDAFIEKPVLKEEWVNGGFMIFSKKVFEYLKPGEFEHDMLKRLIAKNELSLFPHNGFWHAMDTYQDVNSLNLLWKENSKWKVWK